MHPNADRLLRVPLFAGLSDEERERIASWLDIEEHPAGVRLAHEGTSDYSFFVLDTGEAKVEHDGETVGRLGPGDVFGELALLGDGHRQADVVAETDVRIFSLFGTHFREMQMTMPEVAERLRVIAAERLSIAEGPAEPPGLA